MACTGSKDSTGAGGANDSAGGSSQVGGSAAVDVGGGPSGGAANFGGANSSALPAGGSKPTGGTTSQSSSSTVGGRGAGVCPGGSYPSPDLSGTATVVTSSPDSGQYEGTLWLDSQGVLLFSGMNTSAPGVTPSTIARLTPPNTVNTSYVADSGTNGLAIDSSGNVLGASHKERGIVAIDLNAGTITPWVTTDASGRKFNSVNDLTVRTDGTIYFTDPDYQLGGRTAEIKNGSTIIKGVYSASPSRVVTVVDAQFNEPNGIALSPDESFLYVADTAANAIRRFSVAADGSTSSKIEFATIPSPDGDAVDCAGNLYWASNATPGTVVVFSPAGMKLGTINLGANDKPTNLAFGGTDHKTLYISTSPRKIYAVTLNVPGFPY